MKILALESSGLVAGAALLEDHVLVAEYTTDYKKTHSQTLLPMLAELCRMVELDLKTVDVIGVAAGPGSFTGLRIGSATAKGLGLALGVPLAAVPTMDAMAYNLYGCQRLICPMMDARRAQVYTGLYFFEKGDGQDTLRREMPQRALSVADLTEEINRRGKEVIFLGDGADVYRKELEARLRVPYSFAPAFCSRQRAASVAALAAEYAAQGKLVSAAAFVPEYLRLSQAERERMQADETQREQMRAGIKPENLS